MIWQDIALIAAGVLGGCTALLHGVLVRRLMTNPMKPLLQHEQSITQPIERLVPLLLDFSAFNWFLSGAALIAAAIWMGQEAKILASLLAGSSFLFAALCNFWGTHGRHPGWALYTVSSLLIVIGLTG